MALICRTCNNKRVVHTLGHMMQPCQDCEKTGRPDIRDMSVVSPNLKVGAKPKSHISRSLRKRLERQGIYPIQEKQP